MTADAKPDVRELIERLDTLYAKISQDEWFVGHGEGQGGLTVVDDGLIADNCLFPFQCEAHEAEFVVAIHNAYLALRHHIERMEAEMGALKHDIAQYVQRDTERLAELESILSALGEHPDSQIDIVERIAEIRAEARRSADLKREKEEAERELNRALEDRNQEVKLRQGAERWASDLQSGMYVNCVYCGHRYGPGETTPVSMADALKAHIGQCPKHPMSALKTDLAARDATIKAVQDFCERRRTPSTVYILALLDKEQTTEPESEPTPFSPEWLQRYSVPIDKGQS